MVRPSPVLQVMSILLCECISRIREADPNNCTICFDTGLLPLASSKEKCLNLGLFFFEFILCYHRAAKLVKAESLLLLEDWREAGEEVGGQLSHPKSRL